MLFRTSKNPAARGAVACSQLALSTAAPSEPRLVEPRLSVCAFDMSLHAATCVDGRDRKRLARYLLRPAFCLEAITATADGRIRLDIPRRGRCVTVTPHQLLAKLAALVPSPGSHLVRYYGVFANRHHLRSAVAPTPPSAPPRQLALLLADGRPAWLPDVRGVPRHRRLSWARLLVRVFSTDVTRCPCGGRLRPLGAVLTPEEISPSICTALARHRDPRRRGS